MSLLTELKELGVNTDEGMTRFMNNEKLYEKMLGKFVKHAEGLAVLPYLESGDYEKALENAHTLKGVTGNLSLTPLFAAYDAIVTDLRAEAPEKAKERMQETLPVQQAILACLSRNA